MWGRKVYISNLVRDDKEGFDHGVCFESLNIITLMKNFAAYLWIRGTGHAGLCDAPEVPLVI